MGVSKPVMVPPIACPEATVIVPTSWSSPRKLSVKSGPEWHEPQLSDWNNTLPACAAAVSVPFGFRNGLIPTVVSDVK